MTPESAVSTLETLFGSFRAESLQEKIYQLFKVPQYFYYLSAPKSCVLLGGRGSGKTTALKCMSYEGQAALGATDFGSPAYVGMYLRFNTNTVRSFFGNELSEPEWHRLFGHFINISLYEEAANYVNWLKEHRLDSDLDSEVNYSKLARSLGIEGAHSLEDLLVGLDRAREAVEFYINNFSEPKPTISPLGTPLQILMTELSKLAGHSSTKFYIIYDEYENLLDYQQRLVNTLIKHAEGNYFFKIGVRELGWRERSTINPAEVLISPSDYERIRIEEALEGDFPEFAKQVCEARLQAADLQDYGPALDVDALLPGLSIKDEAVLLGVGDRVASLRHTLSGVSETSHLCQLHDHELFVFYELSGQDVSATVLNLTKYQSGDTHAANQYDNYAYSMLFAIAGKGDEIRKYYCGHSVLAKITHQNIRFYMQLINECVREQVSKQKTISHPIEPKLQTVAARKVGLSYLKELEGVSAQGGSLARLLLGLGRVFQLLASNPVGGRPECNQFEIAEKGSSQDASAIEGASQLLTEAVMHLALVRTPGTKLTTEADIRSWDYAPHPIFAPYFGFSHRRKRKMSVSESDILSLTRTPQAAIKRILGRRADLAEEKLPTQMSMFDEYFR